MKFLSTWVNNKSDAYARTLPRNELNEMLFSSTANLLYLATPVKLREHEIKVFNYYQTFYRANRLQYSDSEYYRFYRKLITLNTKQGLKNKAVKTFNGVLTYLYTYFDTFNNELYNEYPNYAIFFEFSRNFPQEFYRPDFLTRYVHLYLELIFLIKRVKPRKKQKKKKLQQKVLISYIPRNTRANLTLRIINAYITNSNVQNRVERIGNALFYLVLSGKTSFLYKKKINMYNKLLEKKKFY